MGISDMISRENKVKKVDRLAKGKTKAERRKLEEHLLKPEKIKVYGGNKSQVDSLAGLKILLMFHKEEEFDLFHKYFKVNEYSGKNVSNVDLLVLILKAFDRGSLLHEDGKIYRVKGTNKYEL